MHVYCPINSGYFATNKKGVGEKGSFVDHNRIYKLKYLAHAHCGQIVSLSGWCHLVNISLPLPLWLTVNDSLLSTSGFFPAPNPGTEK